MPSLCVRFGRSVPRLCCAPRFDAGERAMHRAIEGLDIAWVTVLPAELRNINTPDELDA